MHRVEAALSAIEGQKGGVEQVFDKLHMGPCSGLAIEPINVNAVAARIALARRAAPDIGQIRNSHGSSLSLIHSFAQASGMAATRLPGSPAAATPAAARNCRRDRRVSKVSSLRITLRNP